MSPLVVPMIDYQEVHCLYLNLRELILDPSEGFLVVPIMTHHGVPCLEIHLRSPDVRPNNEDFLRPV